MVEIITSLQAGLSIQYVFAHNNNWNEFKVANSKVCTPHICAEVRKMIYCGESLLGWHLFVCPVCGQETIVYHTCKGRICSSCGKRYRDEWLEATLARLPQTVYHHLINTIPGEFLYTLILLNKEALLNLMARAAAEAVKDFVAKDFDGAIPGIQVFIHTFGAKVQFHAHIHLVVCDYVVTKIKNGKGKSILKWQSGLYFPVDSIRERFKYHFKEGLVELLNQPDKLKMPFGKTAAFFLEHLNRIYSHKWWTYVKIYDQPGESPIAYLGRYSRRAPISEYRLKAYDGKYVTYEYKEKISAPKSDFFKNCYFKTVIIKTETVPVFEFIRLIIKQIFPKYFKSVRYYGFLANRVSKDYSPSLFRLLHQQQKKVDKKLWRDRMRIFLGHDPLYCQKCQVGFVLAEVVYPFSQKAKQAYQEYVDSS